MDGIFRWIRLKLDERSARRMEQDAQAALQRGTDPTVAKRNLKQVESSFQGLGRLARRLAPVFAGLFGGRAILQATTEAQGALAQLDAIVRSTGEGAGYTTDQLVKMSVQMSRLSTQSRVALQGGLTRLLAYTNIQGDAFDRAAQAALDMSEQLGISMVQAAEGLGRALDNPITGLGVLSQQGFKFTDQQRDLMRVLVESGRLFEAQSIILDEVAGLYEGAAVAARNTFGGALAALRNELNAQIALTSEATSGLVDFTNSITDRIPALFEGLSNILSRLGDLLRLLRDVMTAVVLLAGARGLLALRNAMIAAGGATQFLSRRMTELNASMGKVGLAAAAIATVIIALNRMRDSAKDAAEAIDAAIRMRQQALVSNDVDTVREALIAAQTELARLRDIAAEQRALRRATTQEFKDRLAQEEAAVEALSRRYSDLIQQQREAFAPDVEPTAVGERTRIGMGELPGLLGTTTAALQAEAVRRFGREIAAEFDGLTQTADASMQWLQDRRAALLQSNQDMLNRLQRNSQLAAAVMSNAFQAFFDGMVMGFDETASLADRVIAGFKGFGRAIAASMADGMAELQMAKGTEALAEGTWPPNPLAIKSAMLHFAAAGLFRAIAGSASGGGRGGGMSTLSTASRANLPTSNAERQAPEINIYIDPLNPSNPAWQSNLAQTLRGVTQRYGSTNVNVRPRTA